MEVVRKGSDGDLKNRMEDFMEITVIGVVVCFWLMPFGLRLVIEILATVMMFALELRARGIARAICEMRNKYVDTLNFDRKSSRAERRAMATGLRLALRQTNATSLFPTIGDRARRLASACKR